MKLSGRGRIAAVGIACVAVGAAFGPTFATAAGTLKEVIVENTADNPVPTSAVGTTQVNVANADPILVTPVTAAGPTATTVSRNFTFFFEERAAESAAEPYVVPAGKHLEIEFVSFHDDARRPEVIQLYITKSSGGGHLDLVVVSMGGDAEAASQPVKFVAGPGDEVSFHIAVSEPPTTNPADPAPMRGHWIGTLTDA